MLSCTARIFRPHGLVWKGMSLGRWMASAPAWWAKGWPRERVDSLAEAELLSQLAVALKPRTKIGELFRRFPAPEGWGGTYLDPDLAVHGVLKRNGALFVEYDGYWRHSADERLSTDLRKNAALLSYAPASSRIVRIGHWERNPTEAHPRILWITVDQWSAGSQKSISKILKTILLQILTDFGCCLQPHVSKRLQKLAQMEFMPASTTALEFANTAARLAGRSTKEELFDILKSNGFSSSSTEFLQENPRLCRFASKRQIRPMVNWLLSLGLSDSEIAKVLARCPQILGLSIENNVQPTLHWFSDLGLAKSQVVKAVARQPQILGLSIEQNLKPTVQWFSDLGLAKSQVAKAVATEPQILGFSIEQNLQPTIQWLLDLGLSKTDIAKGVASWPRLLGFSVSGNLSHKVLILQDFFSCELAARLIAKEPRILGYASHRLSSRLQILAETNESQKILSAIKLSDSPADLRRAD